MEETKLYNLTQNFVLQLDSQANIVRVMPDDAKPLGYSRSNFLQTSFTSVLSKADRAAFNETLHTIIPNKKTYLELPIKNKKGNKIWHRLSIVCKIDNKEKKYFIHFDDINELKKQLLKSEKTVEELTKANALNNQVINSTQAIILVLNPNKTIKSISKGIENTLGYSRKELLGKNWFSIVIPKVRLAEAEAGFEAFINSKKISRVITVPATCKDGTQKTIAWKTNKITTNGNVIGIVAIGKDVTDITTEVRKLEVSEKRFRNLAEQMQHPIAFVTEDGKFVFLNNAFTKQFGYTLKDSPNISAIINNTNEDEKTKQECIVIWENEVKQLFKTQKPVSNKIEIETRGGRIRQVEYTASLSDDYVCYVYTDITERKAKEEQLIKSSETFKQIAANTPVAIAGYCITNSKITFANKYFTNALGYSTSEINQMQDWGDLIVYDDDIEKEYSLGIWEKVKTDLFHKPKSIVKKLERKIRSKDGTVKTFEIGITYDNGIIYALFYDITARKINEKRLKESEERFRQLAELVPIPISFIRLDGEIIFFNKTYTKQFSYTTKEVTNITTLFDISYTNSDERNAAIKNWEHDISILKSGSNINGKRQVTYNKKKQRKVMEYSATLSGDFIYYAYLDITDRLEKDQILLKEAELFRKITDNTPIAVAGCDFKTLTVTFLNKEFYRTFGYLKKDIQHFNEWFALLISDTKEESEKNNKEWQTILSSFENNIDKNINLIERNIICKNGKIKVCQIGFTINEGTIYGFFYDITDRKETEKKLLESEKRFRSIVEHLPIPLVSLNPITGDLFANKKHQNVIGYHNTKTTKNKKDLSKFSIDDLVDENSKNHFKNLINKVKLNDANTTILEPSYKVEIVCKDKKNRTFEITENIFGNTLYSIFHDITDQLKATELLKESEQKFKALAENMPMAIGGYDSNNNVIFLNNHFTLVTGYTASDVPTVKEWYKKTQPKITRRQAFYEHWMKTVEDFRTKKIKIKPEIKATSRCKDGSFKHFTYSFSIYKDVTYFLIIDITEQEKAKKELEKSHKELRNLASHLQEIREEERKSISRKIHDELGQQITGMKMDVSSIFKKRKAIDLDEELKRKEIIEAFNASIKIVRKIATQLRPSILDDLGVIATFEWLIQDFKKRTGIECNFYYNINENQINIDFKNNLFRILQESLTNITRHSSATSVSIDFFIMGDLIRLIIADNGKGFNQNSPKETLGIIGMRERTSILNGSFVVVSEKMKGTRIIISIPLNK